MAMAMAPRSLVSTRSFSGDFEVQGFVRKGEVGTADRNPGSFYAMRVRCGKKKEKNLAGKLAKVQELVKMQRELVLLSSTEQGGRGPIGDLQPDDSIQIAMFNINVLNRIIKNLEDLQAEADSFSVKAKKKKPGFSFSSSCSSSLESSGIELAKAVEMQTKNSATHTRTHVANAGQNLVSENTVNSIATVPLDLFPTAMETMNSLIVPPFHSVKRPAAALRSSDDVQKEESAIVAQIRALCSTANSALREIHNGGPIELKNTPGGRVIVHATSSSLPSLIIPREISTSGTIEVCTVGNCKRGGSQQILASLQGCTIESSSISVTSCKCMGKCKSAPNVRVKDGEGQTHLHSHVSMDNFSALLEMHFGVQASADQSFAAPRFFAGIDSGVAAA